MAIHVPPNSLVPPPQDPGMANAEVLKDTNRAILKLIVQRLNVLFSSGTFSSQELTKTCPSLARGIDFALSTNDVPEIAHHLPSLVKQVYQHRTDASLQSAITMLMISVKNACRSRWFCSGDSDELLEMANELIDSFRTGIRIITEVTNVKNTISKIIPRFYPQWKLCRLLVSFEAEPGYGVLMYDFHIEKFKVHEETVSLFIAQTDDLETSSCLIHPPRVSFLVNGKSVAGRTCFSQDKGPQFPTNITKMVKLGTNIIQLVGYFSGNYIISVAYMSKATDFPGSELKEHVQPALAPEDPEIIEGSSRISLNCPISLRRIQMPVKGHRCKHLQCFDYDNFLEMNSRNPSWRCPCCNQFTSFIDLRIDQNMVNILRDVTADATDVVISPDGSCKVVLDRDGSNACPPNGTLARQDDQDMGIESNNDILDVLEYSVDSTMDEDGRSNSNANAVDLTMDEEDRNNRKAYEIEDRKPFKDFQESHCLKSFPEQPLMHPANARIQGVSSLLVGDICPSTWSSTFASLGSSVFTTAVDTHRIGTLESLVPTSVLNPVITDAISPAVGREATISLSVNQQASTAQNVAMNGQLGEDLQMQMPCSGNSITSIETERQSIPRQVSRIPIAVQAHLERSQACSSELTQPVKLNSSFNNLSNSPSVSNQANIPTAASLDGLPSETVDVEASSSSGRSHSYLMNSRGSLIISHQTAPPVIVIPDGDVDMPEVSSGLDIVSPLEHHSITQKQYRGCQSSMSSAFQQAGILPSPNQVKTLLPSDLQATSAYNTTQPPLSHHQIPLHQSVNVRGTTTAQSSFSPSQNAVGVPGVNLVPGGYLANYYTQLLAAQQVARMGRVPSVSPYASISGSSLPVTANNLQSMGFDQLQHTVGGPLIASEQNWRPMARMRGSLSGAAYSAALNHYLVPPSQTVAPSSAYAPSSVTASEQILMSNYNSTYMNGSFVQQANWRNSGPGS